MRRRLVWLEAGALLLVAVPTTKLLPYRRVRQAAERWSSALVTATDENPSVIGHTVERLGRRLPGSRCLDQALVAHFMLKRRALESKIVMGVQKSGEALAAHAWVESGPSTVIGAAERDAFVRLGGTV